MKRYNTPELVAVGRVIDRTQGAIVGNEDPSGRELKSPVGSVGFSL